MRLALCLILVLTTFAVPAFAGKHSDELKSIEADLKKHKDHQKELADTQVDIEKKLENVRQDLINISSDIQLHERTMAKLNDQRQQTETDIEAAQQKLQNQRKSLAEVIMALQRLNRMPPQALLARPSAPIDMARSFGLLQKVIPAVSEQAQQVKLTFDHLQELHLVQADQQEELAKQKAKLDIRQARLEKLVKQRQILLSNNQAEQQKTTQQVTRLANRASTLKDLLEKITRQIPPPVVAKKPDVVQKVKQWFGDVTAATGNSRLPVIGKIQTGYGQNMGSGNTSQGLSITAEPGAIVTAPSNGVIRFAGPFRHYKLLVIIQHPNGEHSLLGGMQELYTRTGATVTAGEPLGKLPRSAKMKGDSSHSTSLYYERRRNGKPIDPRQARG